MAKKLWMRMSPCSVQMLSGWNCGAEGRVRRQACRGGARERRIAPPYSSWRWTAAGAEQAGALRCAYCSRGGQDRLLPRLEARPRVRMDLAAGCWEGSRQKEEVRGEGEEGKEEEEEGSSPAHPTGASACVQLP